MATLKKGQLTATDEWARHLRPFIKRIFWKAERRAAAETAKNEARQG